jgi:hypothetical protein
VRPIKGIVIRIVDERGNVIRNIRSRDLRAMLADDVKIERKLVATEDGDKLKAGTTIKTKEIQAMVDAADQVESVRVPFGAHL